MSFRPIYLEKFLFQEKKDFSDLLMNDLDNEADFIKQGIMNFRESMAEKNLVIQSLSENVKDPLAYRKKQLELAKKSLKRAKEYKEKNELLKEKLRTLHNELITPEGVKQVPKDVGEYGFTFLLDQLKNYIAILKRRCAELANIIETAEKDIVIYSKLDEKAQREDLENKLLLHKKFLEKDDGGVSLCKEQIRQLQAAKKWLQEKENAITVS